MKNKKGLSLIEILVALIIVGIIAACVSAAIISGYYMLKKAEHKSRAMSITHVILQEYMAKSFDHPGENRSGDDANVSSQFADTQDNAFFSWKANVTEEIEGTRNVPYKNITVETLYTERNPRNETVNSRTIRLSNIVTYPLVHILSNGEKFTGASANLHEAPRTNGHLGDDGFELEWQDITGDANGVLSFNYRVPKDLIIMYNLAISYDSAEDLEDDETVFTRAVLDGDDSIQHGIITRTPVVTQIFINNIVQIPGVPAGEHRINVEWCHEAQNTRVFLRAYDATIIAFESK